MPEATLDTRTLYRLAVASGEYSEALLSTIAQRIEKVAQLTRTYAWDEWEFEEAGVWGKGGWCIGISKSNPRQSCGRFHFCRHGQCRQCAAYWV